MNNEQIKELQRQNEILMEMLKNQNKNNEKIVELQKNQNKNSNWLFSFVRFIVVWILFGWVSIFIYLAKWSIQGILCAGKKIVKFIDKHIVKLI